MGGEEIPKEVLNKIFTLACDDGGHTAARLRRVSKVFHGAAEELRFRYVALERYSQMPQFVEAFKNAPSSSQDQFRDLYMYIYSDRFEAEEPQLGKRSYSNLFCIGHCAFGSLVDQILDLLSERIVTFWCIIDGTRMTRTFSTLLRRTSVFPRLTHLTFQHPDLPFCPYSYIFPEHLSRAPQIFPSLTHVDVVYPCASSTSFALASASACFFAARVYKNLTGIRVTSVYIDDCQRLRVKFGLKPMPPNQSMARHLASYPIMLPRSVTGYAVEPTLWEEESAVDQWLQEIKAYLMRRCVGRKSIVLTWQRIEDGLWIEDWMEMLKPQVEELYEKCLL
ncbi:hypothetical protein NEOLEDRAFT_1131089 [Neolentinus lepideus HHB14362 ss-1]|uniref:F-box domain-containing protein n=1 Tax=Neolentinus lepideus HHB14362 ss-1 TaxID=1314782 RepID=A0A165TSD3_9AGAM|nr:hypothetical protein NEOLEDRAFT_1131089 [Neolentinus lepideus HHB14362 ss-1]